jgi:PAS domain-containing protein
MYGLPPGGFGQTQTAFENLIHPDDRAGVMELVDCALKTGQPTTGEWRVLWPDGSIHWITGRWQVFMNESGEPFRVVGANMDVTGRKRTEEALWEVNRNLEAQAALLQSREELLKIFVKSVPAGVAMLDRDMRYLQVSDRWCADYSVDSSQILGRSRYELFPDIPQSWKEMHRRALEGETLRADEDRWDRGWHYYVGSLGDSSLENTKRDRRRDSDLRRGHYSPEADGRGDLRYESKADRIAGARTRPD